MMEEPFPDVGLYRRFMAGHGAYSAVVVGASSGIGKAIAGFLGCGGVKVTCVGRDAARSEDTAARIIEAGGEALALTADVTDGTAVESALDRSQARFGAIHSLINCAAIIGQTNVRLHEADLAQFDRVYRTNLLGAVILSRAVLPRMLAAGYGRLVHVSSMAGKEGNPGMGAYSASKAALIGLVKAMGKEYAGTGVTINALAPGLIRGTPMADGMPPAVAESLVGKIPLGRSGELEEASALLAWMVSPACSFTTGFTFDLSGGRATY